MLIQYSLSYAVTSICLLSIAVFVYRSNSGASVNKIFSVYCLAIAWWALFSIPAITTTNSDLAVIWCRIFILGAIFIPTLFFHFVVMLADPASKPLRFVLRLAYLITAAFGVSNFTPLFIASASPRFSLMNYSVPGPLFHLHVLYFVVITAYGVYLLYVRYKILGQHTHGDDKHKQAAYLFWTSLFGYLGGIPNYALVYNVEIPILNPFGTYAVAVYGGMMAYIILRYKFLDIEVIVRRATVFAGLFAFAYGTFSVITILGQEIFHKYLGWSQWVSAVPTVLIITFVLRPLEAYLTEATEQFLFQKKYDYRQLLKTFTNEVLTVLDLDKLTEQTVLELTSIVKIESAVIILRDNESSLYQVASSAGLNTVPDSLQDGSSLINILSATHEPIIKNKDADSMQGHSELRNCFRAYNAQVCFPILLHDELSGMLFLGMKKSGEDYSAEDIDILMTLARTLSIAIANARLFDQLSKTQAEAAQREKMAVIGTLAAGINHEICNPLGIVRGQCEMFLLNLRDGIYSAKSKEDLTNIAAEIMTKVIKETDRATAITKKLSGFAKPAKKVENEQVRVEKELDEVMSLLGHDLKLNNISFSKKIAADFPTITADRRQIQEVLFNIIRNAAQAMDKKEGMIEVSASIKGSSAIISIRDNGSGIPADKIGQIFNPFFTTKEPGKGTGLGLFIVRQVIERNKGTIHVDSQEGVGTTFTLSFPANLEQKVLAA